MTLFFADLVREFSSSTGAGDFVPAGAVPGHRRFGEAVPPGARFHYAIAGVTHPDQWETGEGELGSGGSLVRAPIASSAGGALVDFSPGLKTVALTVGAAWFAEQDAAVNVDLGALQAAVAGKAEADHHHDGAYQPLDADLSAIAALQSAADTVPYATGAGSWALAGFTGFARSLCDDADAVAARVTLGLGSLATQGAGAVSITGGSATGLSVCEAQALRAAGSFPFFRLTPGAWSGAHCYLEAGVGANGIGGGDYLNVSVPAGRKVGYLIGGTQRAEFSTAGVAVTGTVSVEGSAVLGARRTGWTAPSGAASRAGFDPASVTTEALAQRVKALIDDLMAHGLIGA